MFDAGKTDSTVLLDFGPSRTLIEYPSKITGISLTPAYSFSAIE